MSGDAADLTGAVGRTKASDRIASDVTGAVDRSDESDLTCVSAPGECGAAEEEGLQEKTDPLRELSDLRSAHCAQMPDPARMEVFIEAMTPPGPAHLQTLEGQALAAGVPIIRPQTQNLLRFFIGMKRPVRILEIGTAVGFSALFMQYYAPAGCRIVTIEKDHERAVQALGNFKKYGKNNDAGPQAGIHLIEGDAAQVLERIREDGSFDLVFMDAAKGQYIRFLPHAIRLLRSGGIMITDNILQEGEILSSRFAVTRRNRTIHARMRAYIHALMEEARLETLLLPTGDGAAVSLKKDL